ncbi:MAG: hypothetical protein AAFV31_14750 [Pseudomonadota bacterium]
MIRLSLVACCAALGGCTTPDVTDDIAAALTLTTTLQEPLQKQLGPQAEADLRAAEQVLINKDKLVLEIVECGPDDGVDAYGLLIDCRLLNAADPTAGAVNAYSVIQFVSLLEGYFAALSALATTTSTDAIQAQTTALLAALEETGAGRNGALGRLGAAAARNKEAAPLVAGALANQFRINALRRVVTRADPIIAEGGAIAAAFFDTEQSPMRLRQLEMFEAWQRADAASRRGDKGAHRAALDDLKVAHAAFLAADKSSPATAFRTLVRHHAVLLDRLTGTPRTDDVLQSLTQIDAVLTALRNRS